MSEGMPSPQDDHQPDIQPQPEKDVLVTPEGEVLDMGIAGTAQIDLEKHGGRPKNKNRLKSVKYAIAGLLFLLRREQSIQFATVVTIIVLILSIWLEITRIEWMILILALGSIWITESINTAIEASINMVTADPNAMAKIGKDVASTATFLSSVVFVVIVAIIVIGHL